jgi:hypothetical protein
MFRERSSRASLLTLPPCNPTTPRTRKRPRNPQNKVVVNYVRTRGRDPPRAHRGKSEAVAAWRPAVAIVLLDTSMRSSARAIRRAARTPACTDTDEKEPCMPARWTAPSACECGSPARAAPEEYGASAQRVRTLPLWSRSRSDDQLFRFQGERKLAASATRHVLRNARSHADRPGHRCPYAPAMQHSSADDGDGQLHR